MTVFSIRLESERATAGWSQPQLATFVGTSQQNISRWINGDNLPQRKWLIPIANAFKQDPNEWRDLWNAAAMEEGEAEKVDADDRRHGREVEKLRKEVARLSEKIEKLAER